MFFVVVCFALVPLLLGTERIGKSACLSMHALSGSKARSRFIFETETTRSPRGGPLDLRSGGSMVRIGGISYGTTTAMTSTV
jgi:hypothetical protein